jgi:hypothetical protein
MARGGFDIQPLDEGGAEGVVTRAGARATLRPYLEAKLRTKHMADTDTGVGRRAVLQTLLGGAGVGFALPALADEHPMHEHLTNQARVATAQKKAQASAGAPQFLDAHQLATLTLLAEQIVPGSTQAQSPAFIDSLLTIDTESRQRRFLESLSAFDGLALAKSKKPWKSLPEADRVTLLTMASTAESGQRGGPGAGGGAPGTAPRAESTPTIRDHFDHLKGWISGAYYSSEVGMKELGWTGTMFHDKFPGCEHGSH